MECHSPGARVKGMQLLPTAVGTPLWIWIAAINNAGTVVGQAYPSWQEQQGGFTANGPFHGLVWNGASVTDIGNAGGTATQLIGINNSGEAIGAAHRFEQRQSSDFVDKSDWDSRSDRQARHKRQPFPPLAILAS